MRLYLAANGRFGLGYVPEWLEVSFEENGRTYELTLDLAGEIDYSLYEFSSRCKGDLIPWTLSCDGEEEEISNMTDDVDSLFPAEKIVEIIKNSEEFIVGVSLPTSLEGSEKKAKDDVFSDCHGYIEINENGLNFSRHFMFYPEYLY